MDQHDRNSCGEMDAKDLIRILRKARVVYSATLTIRQSAGHLVRQIVSHGTFGCEFDNNEADWQRRVNEHIVTKNDQYYINFHELSREEQFFLNGKEVAKEDKFDLLFAPASPCFPVRDITGLTVDDNEYVIVSKN